MLPAALPVVEVPVVEFAVVVVLPDDVVLAAEDGAPTELLMKHKTNVYDDIILTQCFAAVVGLAVFASLPELPEGLSSSDVLVDSESVYV